MLAYHNDPTIKIAILAQLAKHREADELIKGEYWENGKGCAVGCTIHSGNHAEYETRFGIPQMLARLEDRIFEGLPNGKAKEWPERFMSAARVGADLSLVGWKFQYWLLTDEKVNPGINHPLVRDAVKQCADVLALLAKGEPVNEARAAAAEARAAATKAAESARAAESAKSAWSARAAAESAAWAAESAEAAKSATWSAAWAAESAESAKSAWSARAAAWAAESAEAESESESAYVLMADKLIELMQAAVLSASSST
jgi:hypothetical protein